MIVHTPVMLQEVCDYMPKNSKMIVDCTLGHGGHATKLLAFAKDATLVGIDIDKLMINKAKTLIDALDKKHENRDEKRGTKIGERIEYVLGNYAEIVSILHGRKADYILNDLGVNLEHFKDADRGFSIRGNASLDMRFDRLQATSAQTVVNSYSLDQLKTVFETYADFSSSKALELAQHIVTTRKQHPIHTTKDLKLILNNCGLGDKACATIFQAIRIETNGELDNLQKFLQDFPKCLNSTGRCCIITYHSIEDRLVKQTFHQLAETGNYTLVIKKTLKPNYKEVATNRASRSAKMRILEKK